MQMLAKTTATPRQKNLMKFSSRWIGEAHLIRPRSRLLARQSPEAV